MEIKDIIDNFQRSYEERCREKQEPLTPAQIETLEDTAYELFGIESIKLLEEKMKLKPFEPDILLKKRPYLTKQTITGFYNIIEEYTAKKRGSFHERVVPTDRDALEIYLEAVKPKLGKPILLPGIGKLRSRLLKDYLIERRWINKEGY